MASRSCWKCLSRFAVSQTSYRIGNVQQGLSLALFSTSPSLGANPPKKKPLSQQNAPRASKTLKIKKKAVVKTGRPPAAGERKALRKRIVLSNSNALEVPGLTDITADLEATQIGKVFSLPGPLVDQLRGAEAFKTTQSWALFRRPALLVRAESVGIADRMQAACDAKQTLITLLDGEKGTGKSMMLLQAMVTAFLKGWVVINIPEAQDLTMATTEYSQIPQTSPTLYSQNTYTANWLRQIAKVNNVVLSNLHVTQDHQLPVALQPGITLARMAELGARDAELSWPVFQAFWTEITSEGRPPILMALDGLNHIMRDSAYRSPEFELIHAHDLTIVKTFVEYFSGMRQLPNGGAILAATTTGNNPSSYATSVAIKQKEDSLSGREITPPDPFKKIDLRAFNSLQAAQLLKLKGLSRVEARGLMEYWAASGVLRQRVDEKSVTERWLLAGNGVVGEIERGALWMRI